MDTHPLRPDDKDDRWDEDQAISALLAADIFTDCVTATFGIAVKRAFDEQVAKGVIEPR